MTSNPLNTILVSQIKASGPLGLDAFMQLCLHHDPYGYYFNGGQFGRKGDFITAPEISSLFGKTIARWIEAQWHILGCPKKWRLIELGPGQGLLLHEILTSLQTSDPQVELVEASRVLQKQISARILGDLQFVFDLGHLPESDLPTIFIGNEYLDALPIRQFKREESAVLEICVGLNHAEQLQFQTRTPGSIAPNLVDSDEIYGEICPVAHSHVQFMCQEIKSAGGAALLIDYGYQTPPGRPTFQALKGHEMVNPLENPGNADLTALVDFAALKATIEHQNLVAKLESQKDFLIHWGFETLLEAYPDQINAAARLIRGDGMGTLFKALSFQAPVHRL